MVSRNKQRRIKMGCKSEEGRQQILGCPLECEYQEIAQKLFKVIENIDEMVKDQGKVETMSEVPSYEPILEALNQFPTTILSQVSPSGTQSVLSTIRSIFSSLSYTYEHPPLSSIFRDYFTSPCFYKDCEGFLNINQGCMKAHASSELRKKNHPIPVFTLIKKLRNRVDHLTSQEPKKDQKEANSKKLEKLEKSLQKANSELNQKKEEIKKLRKEGSEREVLLESYIQLSEAKNKNKYEIQKIKEMKKIDGFRRRMKLCSKGDIITKEEAKGCSQIIVNDGENGKTSIHEAKKEFYREYFDKYHKLIKDIENLFNCPISFELAKEPAITPSGNLVDAKVVKHLLESGKPDPFNRDLPLENLVINRFAISILNLIYDCS